ncbi:hypothetical protein BT69DRAFT_1242440 [Atractiella rhizophila]|nr:hypothetical protein BT69DRAFT_1242440 [Atractiella rhizophila]
MLPSTENGLLPYWFLFIAFLCFLNTYLSYFSGTSPVAPPPSSLEMFPLVPGQVTGLSARQFGGWTMISGFARMYAAYHLGNQQVYEIATFTLVVAVVFWTLEWRFYRTTNWRSPALKMAMTVDVLTLAWLAVGWWQEWYFVR